MLHSVVGTINWQAPEVNDYQNKLRWFKFIFTKMWCENPHYTEKVDVYACGLIFWEVLMWSDDYPFGKLSDFQIYEKGL
jgi:serine/threonine protein kinase